MLRTTALTLLVLLVTGSAPRTAAAGDDGKLTAPTLKQLLEGMGYGLKELSPGYCQFHVTRNDFTSDFRVGLSSNGRHLYLYIRGKRFMRPAEMPARFWKQLLAQNDVLSNSGAYWLYDRNARALELVRVLPNRGWTPALMRREVNALHDLGKKQLDTWLVKEPDFVPDKDTAADAKERAKLSGRWELVELTNSGSKSDMGALEKESKGKKHEIVFDAAGGSLRFPDPRPMVTRIGPEPGRLAVYLDEMKLMMPARYRLDGDTLILCWDATGMAYPTSLESTKANGFNLLKFKRVAE
jgi:hypothetical protein